MEAVATERTSASQEQVLVNLGMQNVNDAVPEHHGMGSNEEERNIAANGAGLGKRHRFNRTLGTPPL